MNKKFYNVLGEKGAAVIREYNLKRESKYNDFDLNQGLSFYPKQGDEYRFSDHWKGQPASEDLRKCESQNNMILGKKVNGEYQIVTIIKKQKPSSKNIENRVQESLIKIGPKKLIETYRTLNRTGKIKSLPQDLRESLELIFPCIQKKDYSKLNSFLEKYGQRIAKLADVA